ncbi:MAG: cupin domain-containing protein [Alphaproteobacteria bacterium]|nr:cupin domain-containing protein [Alphaproteobacteria bacterium]
MLIDWEKVPVVAGMRAGSTRRGVCGDKMSAVLVTTTPDAKFDGKTHWHDNEQMLIVVSGSITLKIDDRTVEAKPGDLVFFPPGCRHAAIGVGPEGCVYYELFAPARPDQLPGWVGRSVLRFD